MNKLEHIRKEKGLTMAEIAERVGVAVSTYCQYENGDRKIKDDNALKIAQTLGVGIDTIFQPACFTISKSD